jgi:hypothetical protein
MGLRHHIWRGKNAVVPSKDARLRHIETSLLRRVWFVHRNFSESAPSWQGRAFFLKLFDRISIAFGSHGSTPTQR